MSAAATRVRPARSGWAGLTAELDAWAAQGLVATFWWRDDDAVAPTPALDRLLQIAAEVGVAPGIAVIPAAASADLAARLAGCDVSGLAVLQHGFGHINHGAERKAEMGPERSAVQRRDELARGATLLTRSFGTRALPVLVPPWNRIGADLVPALPEIGFAGLSCYRARIARWAAPGTVQANTHIDIVDWRADKRFLGETEALDLAIGHLMVRRTGRADIDEPTGLLTHHLVQDAAAWQFTGDLIARTRGHASARWLTPAEVFEVPR
ncbi:MAG: hypothetical protein EXQ92_07320 [Alphaproteobacteria bacterium]|nr:hypothetical protein [Alphaproteobacteria bacterium]